MNPSNNLQSPRLSRLRSQLSQAQTSLQDAVQRMDFKNQRRYKNLCDSLQERIKDEESYLPQRLSAILPREVMDKEQLAKKIIKMHIAADYLTDCAMELRTTLEKLGLREANMLMQTDKIERLAAHFAAIVCTPEYAGLSDFMTTNDRLIDDMHLIVDRHLNEKLAIV